MSKAEDKALEAYPDFKVGDSFSSVKLNKQRKLIRHGFIDGYHQAEKDLELTWEDIPEIFRISEQLKTSWWFMDDEQTKKIGTQVFWEEVLKHFKERKEK